MSLDFESAIQIAEKFITRFELPCVLRGKPIERDFGWVFFYGPSDPSILVAGNAPIIVNREDGTVHVTGTAFALERYLESYARIGRTYPFAVAEYLVILSGWNPGMQKVALTKLIRNGTGKSLADAKFCTEEVLAGKPVALTFLTEADADAFCADTQLLGASSKRETRFR